MSVRTYAPGVENVAFVDAALGFANVTVPGPLVLVHVTIGDPPTPSSTSEPVSAAVPGGNVIVWSGPALTTGAVLDTPLNVAPVTHVQLVPNKVPFWLLPDESRHDAQDSLKLQRPSNPLALAISRSLKPLICAALRA